MSCPKFIKFGNNDIINVDTIQTITRTFVTKDTIAGPKTEFLIIVSLPTGKISMDFPDHRARDFYFEKIQERLLVNNQLFSP